MSQQWGPQAPWPGSSGFGQPPWGADAQQSPFGHQAAWGQQPWPPPPGPRPPASFPGQAYPPPQPHAPQTYRPPRIYAPSSQPYGQPTYPSTPPYGQQGPWPSGPFSPFPGQRPPRRRRSVVPLVLTLLVAVGLVIFVAGLLNPSSPTTSPPGDYRNEGYTAPPPDENPPELVYPDTEAEAKQYLTDNALYRQTAPRPIRCEIDTVDLSTASDRQLQHHFDQLTACLMKQWAGVLKAAGYEAVRPTVTIYGSSVQTKCGKAKSHNAFYCGADQQVYYARDFPDQVPPNLQSNRFVVDAVIAHEFGHAIQARTGILVSDHMLEDTMDETSAAEYSRRTELQADCLAGIWVGSIAQGATMTSTEAAQVRELFFGFGDDVLSGKPAIVGDHGHGESRRSWYTLGHDNPLVGTCNTWTVSAGSVR